MNFSAWSIRNPVAPLLAFFLLLVLGWQSFNSLPITRFPNIDVPLVAVSVAQSGAAPAEMESQVTKEIEDAVYDLKAVNPNRKPDVDERTPEQLMEIIEAKGREIVEALAALRSIKTA